MSNLQAFMSIRTGTDRLALSAAKVTPSSSIGRARGIPPTGSPSLICSDCSSSRTPKPKVSTGGGTQLARRSRWVKGRALHRISYPAFDRTRDKREKPFEAPAVC
jgi:hypothetical protein